MIMELMKLEIITPNGLIYDGDIKQVTLPGAEGEFGVLPSHASLVSVLNTGVITLIDGSGAETSVAINSGYTKVEEQKVICIVDGAVALSGDSDALAQAIEEAKTLLKSAEASNTAIASAVSRVEQIGKSI
jgi:F-type H+-transporting ATPase subunit epsilon